MANVRAGDPEAGAVFFTAGEGVTECPFSVGRGPTSLSVMNLRCGLPFLLSPRSTGGQLFSQILLSAGPSKNAAL